MKQSSLRLWSQHVCKQKQRKQAALYFEVLILLVAFVGKLEQFEN